MEGNGTLWILIGGWLVNCGRAEVNVDCLDELAEYG